jgi:hypothetical protein
LDQFSSDFKDFCVWKYIDPDSHFSLQLIWITMIKMTLDPTVLLPVQGTAGSEAEQSTPEGLG